MGLPNPGDNILLKIMSGIAGADCGDLKLRVLAGRETYLHVLAVSQIKEPDTLS